MENGSGVWKGKNRMEISFLAIIWFLWKERNARCFEYKASSLDSLPEKIIIKFIVAYWVSNLLQQEFSIAFIIWNWQESAFSSKWKPSTHLQWSPPPPSFVKLYFDESEWIIQDQLEWEASFRTMMNLLCHLFKSNGPLFRQKWKLCDVASKTRCGEASMEMEDGGV